MAKPDAQPPPGDGEPHIGADLRRDRMLAVIRERDYVRVGELSERFGISEVTVRSDLDALAQRGDVHRIRGGIFPSPAWTRLHHDQGTHLVGTFDGQQQRRQATERLPDDHDADELQAFHDESGVGHIRCTRYIRREALAVPVPARIERDYSRTFAEPAGRLSPLTGVARQSVQKQDGRTVTVEVDACETDTISLEEELRSHVQFLPHARSAGARSSQLRSPGEEK
jgi:hypothetical protein